MISLCLTTGCGEKRSPESGAVISAVSPEDCFLCGGGADLPRGEDNIGLISLNTFDVIPIEINRFHGDGTLREETRGVLTVQRAGEKEAGFSAVLAVDADRGMAIVDCVFHENETLDAEQAAKVLCRDCLDQALSDGGTGVGIVDFSTGTVRPLAESGGGFGIGNYYVHCDWDKSGPGASLWVFHLPPHDSQARVEMRPSGPT